MYAIPAGMYASQIWATSCLQQGIEMDNNIQKWLLRFSRSMLGVRTSTPSWSVLQPVHAFTPYQACIPYHACQRQLSHRHVTEPWSSARRVTTRRRSPDRVLEAGVEIKMPSIGGSQWEALSLMHAAERQA
eukprot:1146935-Pelagomonas_calceolata.AAC.1